jgi:hypothetical protein
VLATISKSSSVAGAFDAAVAAGAGRRLFDRRWRARAPRDLGVLRAGRAGACGARRDPHRPAHLGGDRRETQFVVAGLIPEAGGYLDLAARGVCRHRELDTDHELPLEHRKRLALALQREIARLGEHDLRGLYRRRRRKGERGGDERRIPRSVRLQVEALGYAHPKQGADAAAGADLAFDVRGEVGLHPAQLRDGGGRRQHQQGERDAGPSHGQPTGLSGMTDATACRPSIWTLCPFTGGRS